MKINLAIETLIHEADNLVKVEEDVNSRTSNLASSTEEIAASTDMISEVTSTLKEKLSELV